MSTANRQTMLTSKDTRKYTAAQLEINGRKLGDLLVKIAGWQQTAQQMQQQKNQELLAPIQKKALDAIQAVAKENGYTYVISKDNCWFRRLRTISFPW